MALTASLSRVFGVWSERWRRLYPSWAISPWVGTDRLQGRDCWGPSETPPPRESNTCDKSQLLNHFTHHKMGGFSALVWIESRKDKEDCEMCEASEGPGSCVCLYVSQHFGFGLCIQLNGGRYIPEQQWRPCFRRSKLYSLMAATRRGNPGVASTLWPLEPRLRSSSTLMCSSSLVSY